MTRSRQLWSEEGPYCTGLHLSELCKILHYVPSSVCGSPMQNFKLC